MKCNSFDSLLPIVFIIQTLFSFLRMRILRPKRRRRIIGSNNVKLFFILIIISYVMRQDRARQAARMLFEIEYLCCCSSCCFRFFCCQNLLNFLLNSTLKGTNLSNSQHLKETQKLLQIHPQITEGKNSYQFSREGFTSKHSTPVHFETGDWEIIKFSATRYYMCFIAQHFSLSILSSQTERRSDFKKELRTGLYNRVPLGFVGEIWECLKRK